MGSDIGKGGICGQVTLVIVNIIFFILGGISLAIGAWAIASGNQFAFLTGSEIIGGSAILIIAGGVTVIIAVFGIIAAIFKIRFLLVIYAIVVLVIVIAEIVVGIVAVVYRDQVGAVVNSRLENGIMEYSATDSTVDANIIVDGFQGFFSCCGIVNASDWPALNPTAFLQLGRTPPMSCPMCNPFSDMNCAIYPFSVIDPETNLTLTGTFNATTVACLGLGTVALQGLAIGAGVVGLIFGFLEIIGIIIALLLCCCIQRAHKQEVV